MKAIKFEQRLGKNHVKLKDNFYSVYINLRDF